MCYHGFKDIRNPHMTKPSKKTSISWRSASQNGGNALSLKDSLSLSGLLLGFFASYFA